MIEKICEKSICTGCFACQNICPKKAIAIKADKNSMFYPTINNQCIECGLCQKICPANNDIEFENIKKAFAVYSKNEKSRSKSASGGTTYEIAKAFDGIVYGVAFDDDLNAQHIRIENKNELHLIQGSKYVHSHVNNAFTNVKVDLDNGLKVLFTGTPCQVAGLKSYLQKEYDNLYTIDVICHGVPERDVFKNYIKQQLPNVDLKGKYVSFRGENGWNITLYDNNEKVVATLPFKTNFYMHGFLEGWIYRENCYNCKYAQDKRCSDLTLGDFWGVSAPLNAELKKGLNCALVITDKGEKLLNTISNKVFIEERSAEEAVNGNGQLRHPSEYTSYAKKFRKLYLAHNSNYALKNTKLKKRLVFKIRKLLNK